MIRNKWYKLREILKIWVVHACILASKTGVTRSSVFHNLLSLNPKTTVVSIGPLVSTPVHPDVHPIFTRQTSCQTNHEAHSPYICNDNKKQTKTKTKNLLIFTFFEAHNLCLSASLLHWLGITLVHYLLKCLILKIMSSFLCPVCLRWKVWLTYYQMNMPSYMDPNPWMNWRGPLKVLVQTMPFRHQMRRRQPHFLYEIIFEWVELYKQGKVRQGQTTCRWKLPGATTWHAPTPQHNRHRLLMSPKQIGVSQLCCCLLSIVLTHLSEDLAIIILTSGIFIFWSYSMKE